MSSIPPQSETRHEVFSRKRCGISRAARLEVRRLMRPQLARRGPEQAPHERGMDWHFDKEIFVVQSWDWDYSGLQRPQLEPDNICVVLLLFLVVSRTRTCVEPSFPFHLRHAQSATDRSLLYDQRSPQTMLKPRANPPKPHGAHPRPQANRVGF